MALGDVQLAQVRDEAVAARRGLADGEDGGLVALEARAARAVVRGLEGLADAALQPTRVLRACSFFPVALVTARPLRSAGTQQVLGHLVEGLEDVVGRALCRERGSDGGRDDDGAARPYLLLRRVGRAVAAARRDVVVVGGGGDATRRDEEVFRTQFTAATAIHTNTRTDSNKTTSVTETETETDRDDRWRRHADGRTFHPGRAPVACLPRRDTCPVTLRKYNRSTRYQPPPYTVEVK